MKKIIFFLSALFIFSCSAPENTEKMTTATLSGTITNPKGATVKLSNGEDKFQTELVDGKFTLEVNLTEPGYYSFGHGSETTSMYIEPGDNISLTLDPEQFDETISYSGEGAEESNYLAAKYMLQEKEIGEAKNFYTVDEESFIKNTLALKSTLEAFFTKYQKDNPSLNADFVATEKINLIYDWANQRNNYERYYQHYAEDKEFEVGETYNSFLSELDLDNGNYLSSKTYKNFIRSHYNNLSRKAMEEDEVLKEDKKTGRLKAQVAVIKDQVKDPAVKSYLMYGTLKDQISYSSIEGVEPILAEFKRNSNNEKQNTELQELFDKWAVLAKGNIAPEFAYPDIEGKMVTLKDFRGKNVYVDVWATWCGPCKREIPHLEELQEKYKDNENIVFASVSIDEDKEAWEKMVTEKEMMGVQIIGDDAWDSSICKDYLIRGIPRFLLVDKDGKIIDAKAPRPSSDEIKEVLKELAKPALTSMK